MNFSSHSQESGKKITGIVAVVLIHVIVIYALLNGLGKQVIHFVKELPIEVKIIEEVKPPPPPPPVIKPPVLPKLSPPKPFIPLPEVRVQQPTSPNVITAVSNAQPERADFRPQAPVATTSDQSSNPVVVKPVVDFNTCEKPDYPRRARASGQYGTVRIQFLIDTDGRVAETKIEKSSNYRELDTAASSALSLCKFKPGTVDGKPQKSWTMVDYVWKLPN